jgi:hypothetical protein
MGLPVNLLTDPRDFILASDVGEVYDVESDLGIQAFLDALEQGAIAQSWEFLHARAMRELEGLTVCGDGSTS